MIAIEQKLALKPEDYWWSSLGEYRKLPPRQRDMVNTGVILKYLDRNRNRALGKFLKLHRSNTITEIFHGKVVDVTHDSMVIEVTGHQEKLQSFLDMLADYEILELARTGLTGLTRGSKDVVIIE